MCPFFAACMYIFRNKCKNIHWQIIWTPVTSSTATDSEATHMPHLNVVVFYFRLSPYDSTTEDSRGMGESFVYLPDPHGLWSLIFSRSTTSKLVSQLLLSTTTSSYLWGYLDGALRRHLKHGWVMLYPLPCKVSVSYLSSRGGKCTTTQSYSENVVRLRHPLIRWTP